MPSDEESSEVSMVAPGQSLPNWHVGFPAAGEVSFLLSLSFTFGFFFFFFGDGGKIYVT